MFNIGDLIYFLNTGTVTYGVCTSINYTSGAIVSYNVTTLDSPSSDYTVLVANAYPSGTILVTPSPTITITPTISNSRSVTPTPTVTMTPSASNPQYPNLFPSNDTSGWTATNATLSVVSNELNLLSASTDQNSYPKFTKTFTVNAYSYYNLNFKHVQGTGRYFTLQIDANGPITFSLNNSGMGSAFSNPIPLHDSGTVNVTMLLRNVTSITVTIVMYEDSNYNSPMSSGYNYILSNTLLQEIFTNVSLTPPPSVTPTPTPSSSG